MKISVITTTFNRKKMLKEAIESVQKSILKPFENVEVEHVVYDDGSTDGTESLFTKNDWKNVVYIRNEKNNGQSYGKNRALEKATGDFVFILDSDDVVLQRTLHNFIKKTKENPKTSFFIADFLRVDESLKYITGNDYYGWNFNNTEEILEAIFKGEHFLQGNTLIAKKIFFETGMFDENLHMAEDLDLYTRILKNKHFPLYCDFISHLHRVHSNNISKEITGKKHGRDIEKLKEKYDTL